MNRLRSNLKHSQFDLYQIENVWFCLDCQLNLTYIIIIVIHFNKSRNDNWDLEITFARNNAFFNILLSLIPDYFFSLKCFSCHMNNCYC